MQSQHLEAEASELPECRVRSELALRRGFQASLGYTVKPCLKTKPQGFYTGPSPTPSDDYVRFKDIRLGQ